MTLALLAPGYGATGEQPLLLEIAEALAPHGIHSRRVTFTHKRPSPGYAKEQDDLRRARDESRRDGEQVVFIGRSYGGRMLTLLAAQEPPAALVVLGYPIRPPGKPRPEDEAALRALTCPTLIVQGDADELGPLPILEALGRDNPSLRLHVIAGAKHSLGGKARERDAIAAAVEFASRIAR